ncbi:MAG: hypothetical protein HYX26_04475 [Acidobacteriales bacterium]|nr:hypothetical protein [Terriglobales bacterium]
MKFTIALVIFAVMFGVVDASFSQQAQSPLSITISTPRDVLRAGSEIRLDITLVNTSDHGVHIARSTGGPELDYEIEICDLGGKPSVETSYGRKIHGKESERMPRAGSFVSGTLQPGKEFQQQVILNKMYDLSQPGKYVIQVRRFDPTTKAHLKSNKIIVTLTE